MRERKVYTNFIDSMGRNIEIFEANAGTFLRANTFQQFAPEHMEEFGIMVYVIRASIRIDGVYPVPYLDIIEMDAHDNVQIQESINVQIDPSFKF